MTKYALAHYFPPYPPQLNTQVPTHLGGSGNYYELHYLYPAPGGYDPSAGSTYGGVCRDMPWTTTTHTGAGWETACGVDEVAAAKAADLDGFVVDILSTATSGSENNYRFGRAVFDAAAADGTFKCAPMMDCNALASLSSGAMAGLIDFYLGLNGGAGALKVGAQYVVSTFLGERFPPSYWDAVLTALSGLGKSAYFVPCFNDWNRIADGTYDGVADGYGIWGERDPQGNGVAFWQARMDAVQARGKIWMHPIAVQDERPNQHVWSESSNTLNLRTMWDGAIAGNADWAQLITWCDYSEGTAFGTSRDHGTCFQEISKYFMTKWKTGAYPAITTDKLYLIHRKQFSGDPTSLSAPMAQWKATPAQDKLECLAFLTAPATVTVSSGGVATVYNDPAGFSAHQVDLHPGTQQAWTG